MHSCIYIYYIIKSLFLRVKMWCITRYRDSMITISDYKYWFIANTSQVKIIMSVWKQEKHNDQHQLQNILNSIIDINIFILILSFTGPRGGLWESMTWPTRHCCSIHPISKLLSEEYVLLLIISLSLVNVWNIDVKYGLEGLALCINEIFKCSLNQSPWKPFDQLKVSETNLLPSKSLAFSQKLFSSYWFVLPLLFWGNGW